MTCHSPLPTHLEPEPLLSLARVERRLNPARAVWVAPFIGGMFAAMVAGLARL